MAKASLESLNDLHDAVAKELKNNLADPKTLANAIKFLKDNDITADLMTDEADADSLGNSIKAYLIEPKKEKMTVQAMLEMSS